MTPSVAVRAGRDVALVILAAFAIAVLLVIPASAAELSAEQESMANGIEGELIAPCCWTQTVADHDSSASDEIKAGIRSMVASGSSRGEIIEFYKDRYGAEILAAPQKSGFDLMAYVFPAVVTLAALALIVVMLMRWRDREEAAVPVRVDESVRGPSELRSRLDDELERFDS